MKKSNSVRQLLGLKQKEMAMLLGISRAQWSMYECGRRDLPLGAGVTLADIVSQMEFKELSREVAHNEIVNTNALQIHIKKLLKENDFQRLAIERKLANVERRVVANIKVIQLGKILNNEQIGDQSAKSNGTSHIIDKANSSSVLKSSIAVFDLLHRLEQLNFDKKFLESKLNGTYNKTSENHT